MGFWSTVGSCVSSAVSMVSSAVSSIGSSLGTLANTVLKVAGPWIGPISQIVSAVAQLLGVFKKEDDPEELGAKAMQSDKKPEDFGSSAEYIEHLRNEVTLDKEKFEEAGKVERAARLAIGTGIAMRGINENKGFDVPVETWLAMAKLGLEGKAQEVDRLLEAFKDGKLEDFAQYVDGKLDIKTEKEVGDTLVEMYQALEPDVSIDEIEDKVMKMEVGDIEPKDK
ncbi:MAG: hypothetical protein Q9M28_07920 [Mariprofundaceae bacterium]|nr:hypothetical protein [Mariprofundaceae bacterium]